MIAAWRLIERTLRLNRPLTTDGTRQRTILLIEVQDEDGTTAYGEASPLPGLHPEGLDTVRAQITGFYENGVEPTSSVAKSGIEGAALALTAKKTGRRPAACIVEAPADRVPLNALISLSDPQIAVGFPAAKVKVGRAPIDEEIAALHDFQRQHPSIMLRLDANRAWDLQTAIRFAARLQDLNVEYFEEPLRDPAQLDAFADYTGYGVGLDESLLEARPLPRGTRALIIKPTVLGGLNAALQWIQRAKRNTLLPVVSATFESGVGLGLLAEIACTIGDGLPAQGLNTDAWFEEDVLEPPLRANEGHLMWREARVRHG